MAKKITCKTTITEQPDVLIDVPKLATKYNINTTIVWGLFNKTPGCYPDQNRLDILEQELKKIKGETI